MIASYQIKYQEILHNQSEYEKGDGEQSDQMVEFYYSSETSEYRNDGLCNYDPIYCSFDNSCKVSQSQLGFKLTTFLSKTS